MKIRLIVTDCDGVLTDGSIWMAEKSSEILKRYSFKDIMGLNIAQRLGIRVALMSAEPISKLLQSKLDIRKKYGVKYPPFILERVSNKKSKLVELMKKLAIKSSETLFIGDDVNDIAAMKTTGFSATVTNALPVVKKAAKYTSHTKGGFGAVREIVEKIVLSNYQNQYQKLMRGK